MAQKLSDSEKRKNAIEYLKRIGFLIVYNDLELYHGRVKSKGELKKWKVQVDVDNSSKAIRDNIMGIPCLCVANHDIAEAYAKGTSLNGMAGEGEIHEIIALDNESLIVNEKFKLGKLSQKELDKFYNAIKSLSKGSVKKYCKDINNGDLILSQIKESFGDKSMISVQDEALILDNLNKQGYIISEAAVQNVVGAINAYNWFNNMPVMAVSDYVFLQGDKRNVFTSGGHIYNQNLELIRQIFDTNNIIALKKKNFSSEKDHIVYVFNLEKVQTAEKANLQEKE